MIPIHLITPKWSSRIMEDPRIAEGPLCHAAPESKLEEVTPQRFSCLLAFPGQRPDGTPLPHPVTIGFAAQVGEPEFADAATMTMRRWGLTKLGPGVWKVMPSIVEKAYGLHAYVVLCDVPEGTFD